MEISSPFSPVSPQAQQISSLFILTLIIAAVIFLLVTGLVLYAMWRFRSRDDETEPRQVYGNLRLEVGWTIAPALILAVLLGMTIHTMQVSDPPNASAAQSPDLTIVAHQWWWEVHYPQAGVVTANEIHLPAGQRLWTQIEAADVIHDFWVPQIGRKMDAVPGHPNQLWLQADKPGTYLGACAEYCGAQHAWMRIRVIVQSPADFTAWLQQQAALPAAPSSAAAIQGAQLFQGLACGNCHAIAGTAARAAIGPDLTHIATRETLGAGVLDNSQANLTLWLKNPQAVKPGSHMPSFNLSDDQVNSLVSYLEGLQ